VDKYTTNSLNDLFMAAAETERKLPPAIRKQKMSSWPEYVQEWSAYGWHSPKQTLPKATPKEISEYDQALLLGITHLDSDDRRLIWMVAQSAAFRERGPKWQRLARIMGLVDGRQVRRRYEYALNRMVYRVNAEPQKTNFGLSSWSANMS